MYSYEFFIKTEKRYIDYINKIVEAHEGIGIVRTIDPEQGRVKLITTSYFIQDAREVLLELKKQNVNLEITSEKEWEGVL